MESYKGATNHHLETTNQPALLDVPVTPASQVRPHPKVRFQKPLTLLQLTATQLGITHQQSRHKLDLNHPAPLHQEIPLRFFQLLPSISTHHPPHNRTVCG